MTSPTVTEPRSTATELRHDEASTSRGSLWSYADRSPGPSTELTTVLPESSNQTIEVAHTVVVNVGVMFTQATTGLTISWPDRPRTYEDDLRAQVSALWAEDWDSEDDAVYDDW